MSPNGPIWAHMAAYGPIWAHGAHWARPTSPHLIFKIMGRGGGAPRGPHGPIWAHVGAAGPIWVHWGSFLINVFVFCDLILVKAS